MSVPPTHHADSRIYRHVVRAGEGDLARDLLAGAASVPLRGPRRARSRRSGGPSCSGGFFVSQGGEAWSSRVVHTRETAGSNPAPATSFLRSTIPCSCGPP